MTIHRPQTSELKSISKFQLLFHWKNFEKYMIFYALPWSRWNRTHKWWNTCIVPFAIAELGQRSWSSTHTKKCRPVNRCITVLSIWIMKIFQCYASKQRKNCEETRWLSLSALVWPQAMSLTVVIGFYAWTHSTFNLNLLAPATNIWTYKVTKPQRYIRSHHWHIRAIFSK